MITDSHDDNLTVSQRLRTMPFRGKLSYLWDYYKWIALGILCFMVVGAILVSNYVKALHTNSILGVTLINADAIEADQRDLFTGFAETLEDSEGDEVVTVDASLSIDLSKQDAVSAASFQVLSATLLSGGTDILICDEQLFLKEQENNAFLPLKEVLSGEELDRASDLVVASGEAYGIKFTGSSLQDGAVYPRESALVIGVASTCRDPETAGKFINWFCIERSNK